MTTYPADVIAGSPSRSRSLVASVIIAVVGAAIASTFLIPRGAPAVDRFVLGADAIVAFVISGELVVTVMRRRVIGRLRAIVLLAGLVYVIGTLVHPIHTILVAGAAGLGLCFSLGIATMFCPVGTPSSIPTDVLGALWWFYQQTPIVLVFNAALLIVVVPASWAWYVLMARAGLAAPDRQP